MRSRTAAVQLPSSIVDVPPQLAPFLRAQAAGRSEFLARLQALLGVELRRRTALKIRARIGRFAVSRLRVRNPVRRQGRDCGQRYSKHAVHQFRSMDCATKAQGQL